MNNANPLLKAKELIVQSILNARTAIAKAVELRNYQAAYELTIQIQGRNDAFYIIEGLLAESYEERPFPEALENENGITVRQLKDWLAAVPDYNESGEESEVWLTNTNNETRSNQATSVWQLNRTDIIFDIRRDEDEIVAMAGEREFDPYKD